jgi:outer membrane protein OmpA-like peptidoglycan-associated protein
MRNALAVVTLVAALSGPAWAGPVKAPPAKAEPATAEEFSKAFASTDTVVLHGIVFGPGRATIVEKSRPILDEIKKLLDGDPKLKLSIEVHTDSSGKASANLELSKRRAMALKDALVKRGADAKRLTWQGYGDARPIDNNATPKGKAKNRRVELVKK